METDIAVAATGLDVAYTDPGGNWHGEVVPADEASHVKWRIGPGAVSFRVKFVSHNSSTCSETPTARFIKKPYADISGAVTPDSKGLKPESAY